MSYVYFIQASNRLIKIGVAKSPRRRLGMLQNGSPVKLKLLAAIAGTRRNEAELHRQFGYLRVRGEWFRPGKQLLDHIAEVKTRTPSALLQDCPPQLPARALLKLLEDMRTKLS